MLTKKQNELLIYINQNLRETGVAPSYEEMKEALESWLTPEDVAQEGDIIDDEKETDIPKTNYSVNTSSQTVKQNKLDKFDSLFDESSDKADDLPF